jgi:hypothetical protein
MEGVEGDSIEARRGHRLPSAAPCSHRVKIWNDCGHWRVIQSRRNFSTQNVSVNEMQETQTLLEKIGMPSIAEGPEDFWHLPWYHAAATHAKASRCP